jgi:hypothetical protein
VSEDFDSYDAVRVEGGAHWYWSRRLCERAGFDEYPYVRDGLVDDGFIPLGGMLCADKDAGRARWPS